MQRSNASSACTTITFEEALRREMEYRKKLERTHPHLLVGLSGTPDMLRFQEVGTDSIPDAFKRKLAPETSVPPQQSIFNCATIQKQPPNWYPSKKKVKVPHLSSLIPQCPRPNVVPSFWCKICKVDCVTEFNFGAHIGGKKHKAKKLEILGNRNTGRPASHCVGNRNSGQNGLAVSGNRNDELNLPCSITTGPSCDLPSESRTIGTEESGTVDL
ncbi:hypothetical protein BS78_01G239700 [Paspalum vaginatum]|nr:hypothetical protein BS78_01G239700 [Paspalum vaginatum]